MKIGVFGDSFAVSWDDNDPYWANILRQQYGYDVTNFAHGGTGLDYSYYYFLRNYEKFDKIVFIVGHPHRKAFLNHSLGTAFDRITHDEKLEALSPNAVVGAYQGYLSVSKDISSITPERNTKKVLQNKLEEWALYPETDYLAYHAMQRDIQYTHENTIVIPAFDLYTDYGMYNISNIDYRKFNSRNEIHHKRFNHMSACQNSEFAKYVNLALTDNFDINSTIGVNADLYYTVSKSLKDAGMEQ